MKKFISALLVLTVLFGFTACKPESDPTPTPAVDLTTLDGMYVTTATVSGKPCNTETLVISGNTATFYGLMADDSSLAGYNAATQAIVDVETIVRTGLSFTIEGNTHVYTLEVQDGVGIINYYGTSYMKVLPGEVGESICTMEVYFSEAGDAISVSTFDSGAASLTRLSIYVAAEDYDYSGVAVINGNTYTVTDDDDNFSFSVEFSGSTATLTSHDGFATTPATTYTKYVRTTPWPTVSAN